MTAEEALIELERLQREQVDKVPDEWMLATKIGEIWNVGRKQTQSRLAEMRKFGIVEVKQFTVRSGQVKRPIAHYRFVDPKKTTMQSEKQTEELHG